MPIKKGFCIVFKPYLKPVIITAKWIRFAILKPPKKDWQKYEQLKTKLFDDEFDGYLDDEFLKLLKIIKRNFWHIAILDYIHCKKSMIETLQFDKNQEVANKAKQLMADIDNPKQYDFG